MYKVLRFYMNLIYSQMRVFQKIEFERAKHKRKQGYIYERPLEYCYVMEKIMEFKSQKILDIGCGKTAFPRVLLDSGFDVTCTDQQNNYWGSSIVNRHVYVISDDICHSSLLSDEYDTISCISVLEHIKQYDIAVKEMVRLLRPGGILLITFPFTYDGDFIWNVYDLIESDAFSSSFRYIAHSFNNKNITSWKRKYSLLEIDRRYFRSWTGKYIRCGDRIQYPFWIENKETANNICITLQKK